MHLLEPDEHSVAVAQHLLQAPGAGCYRYRAMLCRRFLGDPLADALRLPVPPAFGWERGGSAALIISLRLYRSAKHRRAAALFFTGHISPTFADFSAAFRRFLRLVPGIQQATPKDRRPVLQRPKTAPKRVVAAVVSRSVLYSLLGRFRWTRRLLHGLHSVGAGMVHGRDSRRSATGEIGTATTPRSGCPYQMLAPPLAGDPSCPVPSLFTLLRPFLAHFPPKTSVFCAFSPSRRDGSNEPQAGTQAQETAARGPRGENSPLHSTPQMLTKGSPGLTGEPQSQRLWPSHTANNRFLCSVQRLLHLSAGVLRCGLTRSTLFRTPHVTPRVDVAIRVSRRWRNAGKGKERR